MKRIKKIVLKDATKLTNSEMKQIRGGYEPERSAVCSVQCYNSSITKDCSSYGANWYCDIVYDTNGTLGVGCYEHKDRTPVGDIYCDILPEPQKNL